MDAVLHFFQTYFPALVSHKYIFLFLGAVIEGFNTMVLGGFLISTKSINFLPSFALFTIGYMINGYGWYIVGYYAGAKPIDKWGRKDPKSNKIISKVQEYFERYSGRAIIITKFTFSLTIATLIMAGSLKYDIKKFSLYNFIGSIGWVAVTLAVGYFFGQSYRFFFIYLKNFTYFIVFLGGAMLLVFILKELAKSAFIRSLVISEKIKEMSDRLKESLDKLLSESLPKDTDQ